MSKSNKQLLDKFENSKSDYKEFLDYVKPLIVSLLKDKEIQYHKIESRVKASDSLERKIEVKDKYTELSEITDLCALRIITYFSDDVDKVANLLEKEFHLDKDNSIDKRKSQDPEKFGYVSLHYILQLNDSRSGLTETKKFKDLKFEVQIRTILQHAWAEIEHDFGYKSVNDVPKTIRRRFSRLAGLFELADDEFMAIKEYEKEYLSEVKQGIGDHSKETQIDSVSVTALLEDDSFEDYLKKYYGEHDIEIRRPGGKYKSERITKIVQRCEYLEIKTIDMLLAKFKEEFPSYFENWVEGKENYFYVWNVTPLLDIITNLEKS